MTKDRAKGFDLAYALDPNLFIYVLCYRIGNLLVPNDNYCKFEDWLMPILDQMLLEQNTEVGVAVVLLFFFTQILLYW